MAKNNRLVSRRRNSPYNWVKRPVGRPERHVTAYDHAHWLPPGGLGKIPRNTPVEPLARKVPMAAPKSPFFFRHSTDGADGRHAESQCTMTSKCIFHMLIQERQWGKKERKKERKKEKELGTGSGSAIKHSREKEREREREK